MTEPDASLSLFQKRFADVRAQFSALVGRIPDFKDMLRKSTGASDGKQQLEKKPFDISSLVPGALRKTLDLDIRVQEAPRYFGGAIMEKALATLDKSAMIIIGVLWSVAIVAMVLAFMAVKQANELKVKAETARSLEPILPQITRAPLSKEQYEPLVARLKKQFPTLSFETTNKPTLRVFSNQGEDFMTWLNAVSYTDSIVPSIRWSISFFCVGMECSDDKVMQAELAAETINITQPAH